MPQLDKLRKKYGDKVNFVAICLNSREDVIVFLKGKTFGYFHLVSGHNYTSDSLKMNGFPRNLFLDKNGFIQEIKIIILPIAKTPGSSMMSSYSEFDKILGKLIVSQPENELSNGKK